MKFSEIVAYFVINKTIMANVIKLTCAYCRSNAYLMIGICLGLSLSLLFAVNTEDCSDCTDSFGYGSTPYSTLNDEYEPFLNIQGKKLKAQVKPKPFFRPRYYSTELGIREKIFVGIVTSREYLHSRGVALNKTLAHLVDKVRYFISIPEGTKPNVSLPGIVGFTDTRSILKPFHVMKYITDNYLEDYDFYYIVKDTSYVNGRKLLQLVDYLSVSREVHLGIKVGHENFCTLEAGILLSNSLVRRLKTSLDWCVKNTFSSSDDVNFGRCVMQACKVPCSNEVQGMKFSAVKLPTVFDFHEDFQNLVEQENLSNSVSVFPIYDYRTIYKINAYFVTNELRQVEDEIISLRKLIVESSHLEPENDRQVSWPIGNEPGNRAIGRFDYLSWIYFNETHSFMDTMFENVRESIGNAKIELEILLKAVLRRIEKEYEGGLVYQRLINGYRKFDASRGMDYILDIEFLQTANRQRIIKRIEVCKPLGKVEILPVPYVTENTRINMILVVDVSSQRTAKTLDFLENYGNTCMAKKYKTFLLLALLYDPESPSKGTNDIHYKIKNRATELTKKYKKDQHTVAWLSIRLPKPAETICIDPMLTIAVADLVKKKFTPESLLLFVDPRMELNIDYLNRVRMNTISQWQIYSPIPFTEYNPDVTKWAGYTNKRSPTELDINRNVGRYEDSYYEAISFYVKDYSAMRRRTTPEIPQVDTDKDIPLILAESRREFVESLFDLFVRFGEVHALRAVEPALKIRYDDLSCNGTYSENVKRNCEQRRNLRLGHRGQLAKLILDYQSDHLSLHR